MGKRKLPIGIQTFRQIREEGYYYVDKTAYARRISAESRDVVAFETVTYPGRPDGVIHDSHWRAP